MNLKDLQKEITQLKKQVLPSEEKGKMVTGAGEVTIGVILEVMKDGKKEIVKPLFKRTATGPRYVPAKMSSGPGQFTISKLQPNREDPTQSKVELTVSGVTTTMDKPKSETLVVEASIKPFINLVWMGTVTLVVGFVLTIIRRVQEAREKE